MKGLPLWDCSDVANDMFLWNSCMLWLIVSMSMIVKKKYKNLLRLSLKDIVLSGVLSSFIPSPLMYWRKFSSQSTECVETFERRLERRQVVCTYRDEIYSLYVVWWILFLLFLNCSAWPAWVLLIWICKELISPLYMPNPVTFLLSKIVVSLLSSSNVKVDKFHRE